MKQDIVRFLLKMHTRYGLNAFYVPDVDVYCVHRRGRAVQNFSTSQFYDLPKWVRARMFNPLVKVGMNQNMGESYRDQLLINDKQGIYIC